MHVWLLQCPLTPCTPARAGRIFKFVHSPAVVNERSLPGIVGVLLGAIRDQPHITQSLFESFYS